MPAPDRTTAGEALPGYPSDRPGEDASAGETGPVRSGRRWPWVASTVLGLILVVAPLAGGMFYPAAQAKAMIGDFAPYMSAQRLDGFTADLARLDGVRSATARIDDSLGTGDTRYPQIEQFQKRYPAIDTDMTSMLEQIGAARSDYRRMSALQPLDVIPFIPVGFGILVTAAGIWGWRRARTGARPVGAVLLGTVAALGLVVTPLATSMVSDADAAGPLVGRFDSVLTTQKVRDVQGYFVVLVGAVGEIDSRYLSDARAAQADPSRVDAAQRTQIASDIAVVTDLSDQWQRMSSDFAGLIGTMNDNIKNFAGVARLNARTESLGFGTFAALPWVLIGAGAIGAAFVAAGATGRRATPAS